MGKKVFILMLCMTMLYSIPVSAKEVINNNEAMNVEPRGVYSEYKWFGCNGGAGATMQILKNDTGGNHVYIIGITMESANGDLGIEEESIKLTSYDIYNGGAYAVFTLEYVEFGTTKEITHKVYA